MDKQIPKNSFLHLGVRLLLFTLVAAMLLAGTYIITKDPIQKREIEASQAAQRAVLPEAGLFEQKLVPSDYPMVTGLYEGKAGENVVGYVLTAAPQGYGGPIPITLGVGSDGSIHGISVGDLQETANIGTKVAGEEFLSQYDALAADPKVIDSEIDTIGGATVSSGPFKQATRQMVALTSEALGIEPHPGQPKAKPLAGDDLLRQKQLPSALSFQETNPYELIGDFDAIQLVYRGAVGKYTAGYSFELAPKGYAGPVVLRASIESATGTVTAVELVSQNETEGYGTRIATDEGAAFLAKFAGKPAENPAEGVDGISGATVTSNAVLRAVEQAGAFYTRYLIPAPDPDEGVAFEDIDLPTPDEYKAVQSAQRGMKDGAVAKYRFLVRVTGYHEESPIVAQVDVDAQGNYLALTAVEQHETEGIGTVVFTDAGFAAGFVGKPAVIETSDEVQAVSGATVTSDALKRALKQTARAYQSIVAGGATAQASPSAQAAAFPTVPGVFEGASFEPVAFTDENKQFVTVKAIDKALQGGAVAGYRIVTVSTGYNETDKIVLQHEIDAAGNFVSVIVLSQAETAGIGANLLEDAAYMAAPVGSPADPAAADKVDIKSGATITGEAIQKAVKHAATAYQAIKEVP